MKRYYAKDPDHLCSTTDDNIDLSYWTEITREQYKEAMASLTDPDDKRVIAFSDGVFSLTLPPEPVPDPTPDPTQDDLYLKIEIILEEAARNLGYNSALHLTSYASSTNETWASEATTFIAWRDALWTKLFDDMKVSSIPELMENFSYSPLGIDRSSPA